MSSPGSIDLSPGYLARSNNAAVAQSDADLDAIIAGNSEHLPPSQQPQQPKPSQHMDLINRALAAEQKVKSDVVTGAMEAVPQAVGGIFDAIGNTAKGLNHLQGWLLSQAGVDEKDAHDFFDNYTIGGLTSHLSGLISPAKSTTGGMVRGAAQFLAGFIPAMRAARIAGLGKVVGGTAAAGASGFATTDPDQPDISNLINTHVQVPDALKPAVDMLAKNPDDPEVVNRARDAVEQAGFGLLTDGVLRGVKAAAQARRTAARAAGMQAPEADPLAAMKAEYGEVKPEDLKPLGDPGKPAVSISKQKLDAASSITDSRVSIPTDEGGQVYINFARINEPEDVKGAMDRMASAFKPEINTARRGQTVGFTTAKGSTYELHADGTTTRNKSFHPEHVAIEGADHAGPQPRSEATFFVSAEDANKLGEFQTQGGPAKIIAKRQDGTWGVKYIEGKDAGKFERRTVVKPADGPAEGLTPIEVFKGGKRVHFGNKITQINTSGVQSNEETARLADAFGMSVNDLLQRRKGQPFNAEEALAARRLWAASGEKLVELADRAASPNAGDVDRLMFRKMMATHYAIQSEVIAARTETARALQSWAIPAGGGVEQARAIRMMLDAGGGEGVTTQLAKRIASLKNSGAGPEALAAMVRKGWGATSMDAVREAYVQGLLWSPSTHIVNTLSNSVVAAQQVAERYVAEGVSNLRADPNGVAPGEAAAMASAITGSLGDAFRMGARAARTGERGASMGSKIELPEPNAISSHAFNLDQDGGLGKAVDWIGFANNIPGRLLMAEDEFFKIIGYRMEVRAQAVRQATSEGLEGADFAKRYADLIQNPPENIRLSAADAALYNTFQSEPGKLVESLMRARENAGPLGWLLLPFVKTPANILAYTFERTPAAPLVARWRSDIAAGGARKDLAVARLASGTALMTVAFDLADSGMITGAGPSNQADREALGRTGWQPYSFKVGDKYVSYQRTDPLAMPLAFAATLNEKFKQSAKSADDLNEWQQLAAAGIATTAQTVVNKTWFTGITNLITAIQEAPKGITGAENWLARQAQSFVPFSSAQRTVEKAIDPTQRQVMNPYDAIIANSPLMSQTLPPQRDLWGYPRKPDEVFGRGYDVLSPLYVKQTQNSPIDAEMARLGAGVERIGVKDSFQGVPVNFRDFPHVYDRYTALAGHDLKHPLWNVGAKDFLDQTVTGHGPLSPIYQVMSDQGKADFISQRVHEYRELAQQEIMRSPQNDEERRFRDMVLQKQDTLRKAKFSLAQ